jgi:hypothetical protein
VKEEGARRFALVRAIETRDVDEVLLTRADRLHATGIALAELGSMGDERDRLARNDRFLERRSALAFDRLAARYPAVAQVEQRSRWPGWINWLLPVFAFAAGAASNVIDGRRLSIIAFPMLGMLLWNLAVYAMLAARPFIRLASSRSRTGYGRLPLLLERLAGPARAAATAQQPLGSALSAYLRDWLSWSYRLTSSRAARLLHVSAAALAIGLLAGMYWRAIGTEYRAGWESTLLGPQAVHGLVHLMLWPASLITGVSLPDLERVAALRWGTGSSGENAGPWLHLYAATAVALIIAPRLALAGWNAIRAARLQSNFPVPGEEDFYVRRLLRSLRGSAAVVRVVPYSYHPTDHAKGELKRLLADVLGEKTQTVIEPPVAYGAEDDWVERLDLRSGDTDHLLVLFNLSATPEAENHGALVEGIRRRIVEAKSGTALAIAVDETAMRQRLGADGAARIEGRRAAWVSMLAQHHAEPVSLDLDSERKGLARRLEAALLHAHAAGPA